MALLVSKPDLSRHMGIKDINGLHVTMAATQSIPWLDLYVL